MSEDTVTVKNICNIHHTLKGIYCWDCVAEISFKAGKSEAYQDLFNWANESCPHQFYSVTKHRCKTCWNELRKRVYKEASPA